METLAARIFERLATARYVATYLAGDLRMATRAQLQNASAEESDRYEELLVNPTLVTLLSQRGAIDCGGFEYVLIRYGHFYQFVAPVNGGHVSIALELEADLPGAIVTLRQMLAEVQNKERRS